MSTTATMIDSERQTLGEVEMVGRDRWEEIHRRAGQGASIRAIARELDLDRRRCARACGKRSGSRTSGRRGQTRCWPRTRRICGGGRPMSATRLRFCFRSCAVDSTKAATKR